MAGPVNVRGFTRADGTWVRPHTRALPTRRVGAGISGGLAVAALAVIVVFTGGGASPSPTAPNNRADTATPSAAGASAKTAPATAHNPAGLPVRTDPGPDGPILGTIPNGATVQVHCYARGPMATGWGNASPYWNKVSYAGIEGFAADVDLDTRRQVYLVVPGC
ncbi:hypothetical protein GCM10023205_77940 [Yinghuangia aomiensis]|uniref:SH3b domain-containing protein n=2 Tax=Yinghuangia aomiensis TaxID=676205 RepID=A0ABP9IC52_9ACTN